MFDEFYSYIHSFLELYAQLSEHLRRKLSIITDGDISALEEIMKQEQAYILKTRSFDRKLQFHKEKVGVKGETLTQMIENLPIGEQQRFRELHTELTAVLALVRSLSESCQSALTTQIHLIEKHLEAAGEATGSAGYNKSGEGGLSTSV